MDQIDSPTQLTLQHSDGLAEITSALIVVQREIENPHKTSTNPYFKSTYVDLTEIINHVRPVLTEHDMAVVQSPGMKDGNCCVETLLLHKSGEWIRGCASSPLPKNDPQGVGSAITYLRRYSLAAMLGLGQEDDDAEGATSHERPEQEWDEIAKTQPKQESSLDSEVPFGKYEGQTWSDVLADEEGQRYVREYIIPKTDLGKDTKDMLADALEDEPPQQSEDSGLASGHQIEDLKRTWKKLCEKAGIEQKRKMLEHFLKYVKSVTGHEITDPAQMTAEDHDKVTARLLMVEDEVVAWLEERD